MIHLLKQTLPSMEIRAIRESEYEAARQLLARCGWAARVADPDRFARMIAGCARTAVAVENGNVIGFARALCDGISNGYISTVVVDEAHRRRGIGRRMIRLLMGDDLSITWVLRTGRESTGFWRAMGFEPSAIAMERVRRTHG